MSGVNFHKFWDKISLIIFGGGDGIRAMEGQESPPLSLEIKCH